MNKKIISITREDVTEYLEKAERTKTDVIKDHLLRILELETKNHTKLKAAHVALDSLCNKLMIANEDLRFEVERLQELTKSKHLRVIK